MSMANNQPRKIFVNLPVQDLERSKQCFTKLGFGFNPKFTDDKAACMIINGEASVMLLTEAFFRSFTRHEICKTASHTEGLFALSCGTRAEVDEMVRTAVALGAKHAMGPQDQGFMYSSSFYDPDGHHWEVLWMDESVMPA